jgi:hypothetical protein
VTSIPWSDGMALRHRWSQDRGPTQSGLQAGSPSLIGGQVRLDIYR